MYPPINCQITFILYIIGKSDSMPYDRLLGIDFIGTHKGIDWFFVSMFLFTIDIYKKLLFIKYLFLYLLNLRQLKILY